MSYFDEIRSWRTWSCTRRRLWLCLSLRGFHTDRGSCTVACSVLYPDLGYTSSPPQCQWPLPVGTQAIHAWYKDSQKPGETKGGAVCRCALMGFEVCPSGRKPFPSVTACGWNPKLPTYLPCYGFETEARQFHYVSQFEYGAQRSFLWMVEAFTDVGGIDPLHQVIPESKRRSRSSTSRLNVRMSHSSSA